MKRLYSVPRSTNVERVQLALAHKGLPVEIVMCEYGDRAPIFEASGQALVPVLVDDDGTVVFDSPRVLEYLERRHPDPPLWPADPARRAETDVFIQWFNGVWKRPPNQITAEMEKPEPDRARIEELGRWMTDALDVFEALLHGRDYLMGDQLSAADVIAFPFLQYALRIDPDDEYLFHRVLAEWMPLGDDHPRLTDWIRRVDAHPRAG